MFDVFIVGLMQVIVDNASMFIGEKDIGLVVIVSYMSWLGGVEWLDGGDLVCLFTEKSIHFMKGSRLANIYAFACRLSTWHLGPDPGWEG